MGGGRKRKNSGKRGNSVEAEGIKDSSKRLVTKEKPKSSPRKLNKRRRRTENDSANITENSAVSFQEDGRIVLVEVGTNEVGEFPEEGEIDYPRREEATVSCNNNATVMNNQRGKLLVDQVYDSSTEEGEASEDEHSVQEGRRVCSRYEGSVVKDNKTKQDGIGRTRNSVTKDQGMCNEEEKQDIIDRAVNQSFKKFAKFMEQNGWVGREGKDGQRRNKQQSKQKGLSNESNLVTTIYERAIQPDLDYVDEGKRLSSSSDEVNDTSGEKAIELANHIDTNLSIIAEQT